MFLICIEYKNSVAYDFLITKVMTVNQGQNYKNRTLELTREWGSLAQYGGDGMVLGTGLMTLNFISFSILCPS